MRLSLLPLVVAFVCAAQGAAAQTVLKAASHLVGGKGDAREDMLRDIARSIKAANVGLDIRIGNATAGSDPLQALATGELDIISLSADALRDPPPALRVTLLPGLVGDHVRAERLNHSPFARLLKAELEQSGVVVLAGAWFSGAVGSTKTCIRKPEDLRGLRIRPVAPMSAALWERAGASIVSMPGADVPARLQTGSLEVVDGSSAAFLSLRLYERLRCVTLPGTRAPWFIYQPVLIAKASFARLTKPQQDALLKVGGDTERRAEISVRALDDSLASRVKAAGVQTVTLTPAEFEIWRSFAQDSVYQQAAAESPAAKALIDAAAAVK